MISTVFGTWQDQSWQESGGRGSAFQIACFVHVSYIYYITFQNCRLCFVTVGYLGTRRARL